MTGTDSGRVGEVTTAVAEHVRALRTARGWSLDELAGRSGVSKGMVVQIEAARTNPSIGTLCRLADAFGVTIGRLLEPATERVVHVAAAEQAPVLWRGDLGGFGRLLASVNDSNREGREGGWVDYCVELWEWRLAPGENHPSADHAPGTRELLHVLAGEVTVTVDGSAYEVRSGQTIEFLADRWHAYRCAGADPARLLMVVVMPAGELDRRR